MSLRRNLKCLFERTVASSVVRSGIPYNILYKRQCVFEKARTLCCKEPILTAQVQYLMFILETWIPMYDQIKCS